MNFYISVVMVAISPLLFLTLFISVFSLFFLIILAKVLSILLIFFKKQLFISLNFFVLSLFLLWSLLSFGAKSLQSCLTLCNPIDGSLPGSSAHGIFQARILEWVVISFSNAWKWKVKVKSLSPVRLFVTSWTAAYQAPPSMGFSRQEYWSGVPLPSPYYLLPSDNFHLCFFFFL